MTPAELAKRGGLVLSALTLDAIQAEATRAHLVHGDHSMLSPAYRSGDRLAILMEEVGEVAHELTYDQGGPGVGEGRRDELVKELIQVAAMAASWVEVLEGGPRAPELADDEDQDHETARVHYSPQCAEAPTRHAPACADPECNCACHEPDEQDEPEPAEYDPGPEVDDEGGMSEYRYHEPEPWQ